MKVTRKLALKGALVLGVALGALAAGGSNSLSAQTAEGTVITNIATATYTDANGNAYADATGQVQVTVAFQGSLDVTSPGAATPASPSTGNTVTWNIMNDGNGADTVQVVVTSSDADVAGNLTFFYAGNPYATPALLNAQLLADGIPAGGNINIDVLYDVLAGEGGNSSNVELTATSTRTGGDNNSSITVVTPPVSGTVAVAATDATADRLPSNGTTLYIESFSVTNNLTGTATLDLVGTVVAPNNATVVITQIRVDGGAWVAGGSTSAVLAAAQVANVEVEYRVDGPVTAAGSNSVVRLTATANAVAGTPNDADDHDVTIVAPLLSVVKTVHGSEADAQTNTTSTLAADPQPGATIWYRVQVTNNGSSLAVMTGGTNGISDDLSSMPVTFVGGSINQTGSPVVWTTLAEASDVISGTILAGLPGGGTTAWFVFAVTIN